MTAVYNRKNVFIQSFEYLDKWYMKKPQTADTSTPEQWNPRGMPEIPLLVSSPTFFSGLTPYVAQAAAQKNTTLFLEQDVYLLFAESPTLKYTQKIAIDIGGDYNSNGIKNKSPEQIEALRRKAFQVAESLSSRNSFVQHLLLRNVQLEDIRTCVLEQLSDLRHLESLKWGVNPADDKKSSFPPSFTPEKISSIFSRTPLVKLELVLGDDLERILEPMIAAVSSTLRELSLQHASHTIPCDFIIPIIAKHLPALTSLSLYGLSINNEHTLEHMMKFKRLKKLSISTTAIRASPPQQPPQPPFFNNNNNNNEEDENSRQIARSFHYFTRCCSGTLEQLIISFTHSVDSCHNVTLADVFGIVDAEDMGPPPASSSFYFPVLASLTTITPSCEQSAQKEEAVNSLLADKKYFPNLTEMNLQTSGGKCPIRGQITCNNRTTNDSSSTVSSFDFTNAPFFSVNDLPLRIESIKLCQKFNLVSCIKKTPVEEKEMIPGDSSVLKEVAENVAASLLRLLLVEKCDENDDRNGSSLIALTKLKEISLREILINHPSDNGGFGQNQNAPAGISDVKFTNSAIDVLKKQTTKDTRGSSVPNLCYCFNPALRKIDIQRASATDDFLEFLCGDFNGSTFANTLTSLQLRGSPYTSHVTYSRITGRGIANISKLLQLEELTLVRIDEASDGELATMLRPLTKLTDLSLLHCSTVGDEVCAAIQDCVLLEVISLDSSSITGASFHLWSKLEKLTCLFVDGCTELKNIEYFAVFDQLNVSYIDAADCGVWEVDDDDDDALVYAKVVKEISERVMPRAIRRGLYLGGN